MRVAIVTVGDELLVGDTVNTNAAWLGERLHERGVDVERVTTLPDRVADIARVVNEYRAEYDAVLVTGGVGPTHDDVTMEVAAAFGREVVESQEVLDWLEAEGGYAADDLAEGTAEIPRGARLLENPEGVAPGCVIGSVYVLPGVPTEMKAMFETVADDFAGGQTRRDRRRGRAERAARPHRRPATDVRRDRRELPRRLRAHQDSGRRGRGRGRRGVAA